MTESREIKHTLATGEVTVLGGIACIWGNLGQSKAKLLSCVASTSMLGVGMK